jgi:hypothetical protein
MIRNDYRRALILLRSAIKGMSGHVRLERRTLNGSMRFSVAGAGSSDNLRALLLRKNRGAWTAAPMGALRIDNRGQAGLTWSFDPRNIGGFALEDYPVVAIVRLNKNADVEFVMGGLVNGAADVDWIQAMSAARAVYSRAGAQPQQAEPEPVEPQPVEPQPVEPQPVEPQQVEPQPVEPQQVEPEQAEAEPPAEPEPVGGLPEADLEDVQQDEAGDDLPQDSVESEQQKAQDAAEQGDAAPESVEEANLTAGEQMALDMQVPWPEPIEPLRILFQQLPSCEPFAADGYTFVRAPLPGSDLAYSLVGVRVEDERPSSVCYGIPGIFSLEPPVGLDGYMWRGDGQSGWWVTFIDANTGEEIGG